MEPWLGLGEARKADLTGQPLDDNSLTGLGVGVGVGAGSLSVEQAWATLKVFPLGSVS